MISSKKAKTPITNFLPYLAITIIITIVLLILVYEIYKGGIGALVNPPPKLTIR